MVMTLPPFLGGYFHPRKALKVDFQTEGGSSSRVEFLGLFQAHLVVHSLCKYVTTCYNYNPNYRWNFILLSPCFSGFQPALRLVLATAGTFWMDWEDWQFIMGQKLGASQVLVLMNHGSELVRKFTDMKQACITMHIYIYTYI